MGDNASFNLTEARDTPAADGCEWLGAPPYGAEVSRLGTHSAHNRATDSTEEYADGGNVSAEA